MRRIVITALAVGLVSLGSIVLLSNRQEPTAMDFLTLQGGDCLRRRGTDEPIVNPAPTREFSSTPADADEWEVVDCAVLHDAEVVGKVMMPGGYGFNKGYFYRPVPSELAADAAQLRTSDFVDLANARCDQLIRNYPGGESPLARPLALGVGDFESGESVRVVCGVFLGSARLDSPLAQEWADYQANLGRACAAGAVPPEQEQTFCRSARP